MIEQQGQVVDLNGATARVRLGGSSGCPACDAGKGCGAGIFGRLLQRRPVVLELDNEVQAVRGQAVIVGLPESLFLGLVARLYLAPLLAALGAAAAAHYLGEKTGLSPALSDLLTLVGAVAGAAAVLWRNARSSREFKSKLVVHLLRVIEANESGMCNLR